MLKIISFFDCIDRKEDIEHLDQVILKEIRKELHKEIILENAFNEIEFNNLLKPDCIAIVDYGALNFTGLSSLKDSYDRFMLKIIENNPSIDFIFLLTMGKDLYKDELFEYSNVHTLERHPISDWIKLIQELRP